MKQLVISLVFAGGLGLLPIAAQTPGRSVNDAVYTAVQAERGQKTFETSCAVCHDTERFMGRAFLDGWKNEPLFSLFDTISTAMPADNPGGLRPQQYADVIAYFLKLNGFSAGASELPGSKEAMSAILFPR